MQVNVRNLKYPTRLAGDSLEMDALGCLSDTSIAGVRSGIWDTGLMERGQCMFEMQ